MKTCHNMIIAIDGYSSCGKSTFAKAIAAKMGYAFIDTGAMYRAVTLYAIEHGIVNDPNAIVRALDDIHISFRYDPALSRSKVYLNDLDVDEAIRTSEVADSVSAVASIAQVRAKLVQMQQQMGLHGDIVMDGRDIGTVVFPNADLKIFMTADVEVRAMRRYREMTQNGIAVSLDDIRENVRSRDHQDENRAQSPLRRAPDALLLDNSHMTVGEQMDWVMTEIAKLTTSTTITTLTSQNIPSTNK